ncbi:MAG TPA: zinc ABC transporter substrate-binding protein [Pseudonocardiaceae bacterium]|nr:zinc ABC transporter substrate-binding protein [Pseudonocardiaceae bacterium]
MTPYSEYDNGFHFMIQHRLSPQGALTMIIRMSRVAATAAALAVLAGTVSCGAQQDGPGQEGSAQDSGGDKVQVVASTNVWAGVVQAVGGDAVEITTIMDDPGADPHSYEASPADAADVARADLVVFNGGGYDEFMDQFLTQAGNKPTVEAVALAKEEPHATEEPGGGAEPGHAHGAGANEHVWYDLPLVAAVAEQVAEKLSALAPAQADRFTAAATTFGDGIDDLNAKVSGIADRHAGAKVVMTEPVAFYLVAAAKLDDLTPPQFTEAVEEETDPPAAAISATRELVTKQQVQVLIYNPQTETPVISQLRDTAESAALPTVTMTETIPAGTTYLNWMSGQIDALSAALG